MGAYSHVKRGPAPDLNDGHAYRSGWERDMARLLTLWESLGIVDAWDYEPETFYFTEFGYKRGPWVYKPDFIIKFADSERPVFWEVKGRETSADRSKYKRFLKHTDYELRVIRKPEFFAFRKEWAERIPEWESWGW